MFFQAAHRVAGAIQAGESPHGNMPFMSPPFHHPTLFYRLRARKSIINKGELSSLRLALAISDTCAYLPRWLVCGVPTVHKASVCAQHIA
jgi:hypothetical protein